MLVTSNSIELLKKFINALHKNFFVKDLGILHYFLGIQVRRTPVGFFLNQEQYVNDLLSKFDMQQCSPCPTPFAVGTDLHNTAFEALSNPSMYRSALGALQYLTHTRSDISFAVNKLSQFLHNPCLIHWQAVKRLLRYLRAQKIMAFVSLPAQFFSCKAFLMQIGQGPATTGSPQGDIAPFLAISHQAKPNISVKAHHDKL